MNATTFVNSLIPQNAIERSELAHQQRSSRAPRRWWHWVGRVMLIGTLTVSMILFWGEVAGSLLQRDAGPIGERLGVITWTAGAVVVIFHFTTMLRTLALAANSLARERQNNTWDVLVLTGIDAREIVWGKWSATVRHMWRQYALLGVMRGAMTIWAGAYSSREYLNLLTGGYNSYYLGYITDLKIVLQPVGNLLLGGVVVFLLTMVNLPFTAACGILASAQIRRSTLALGRAIGIRLLTVLAFSLGSVLAISQLRLWMFPLVNEVVGRVIGTLFLNGVTLGSELSSINYGFADIVMQPNSVIYVIVSTLLSIGLYWLLTRFLLYRAKNRTIREQALPPRPAVKGTSSIRL